MLKLTAIVIILLLLSGCSGSSSSGGTAVYPGSNVAAMLPMVTGTYCDASTTVGIDESIMQDAVSYLDSMAPQIQSFLGSISGKVLIVFDGIATGEYQYPGEIHLSSELKPLHTRLVHEYSHHIHQTHKANGYDLPWLLEVIAEGTEQHFGTEAPVGDITPAQYDGLETVIDWTTQRSFSVHLMKTYGDGVLYRIVNSPYIGRQAVEYATGDSFEKILQEWREGN